MVVVVDRNKGFAALLRFGCICAWAALHCGFRFHPQSLYFTWPQCAWQTFKLYILKHFKLGFRETFKMVNVPMLRKTFCPHPDCKGTKPFRVTNYKSLNEEVTSRKRRLRCWWFDALSRCFTIQNQSVWKVKVKMWLPWYQFKGNALQVRPEEHEKTFV